MNTVKLQDTKSTHKNLLNFYTLTISQQKKKLRKQSHLQSQKNTIKLLKENLRGRLLDLDLGEDILDLTPKQRQQRQK